MQINAPVSRWWPARNALQRRSLQSDLSDAPIESSLIDLVDGAEQYHCTSTPDAKHRAPIQTQGNRI